MEGSRISFEGKLIDGDLIIPHTGKYFLEKLSGYEGKRKNVIVTVELVGKGKAKMLAYYHAVILDVARTMLRDTGNFVDEEGADLTLKTLFASKSIINPVTRKEEKVLLSKADMNFKRLNEYLNDCINFLEEHGYPVPEPIKE
jgi:hypothetical protein